MNVKDILPFIILKIYIKRLDVLSVLSIFVLHVIVEGTWVKCTVVINTMYVEMKNNQEQTCIKVVDIVKLYSLLYKSCIVSKN